MKDQCTTFEQSKKLIELGFAEDTASVRWLEVTWWDCPILATAYAKKPYGELSRTPCWTIADMMKILSDARGFDLDVLGKIGIYSADEPCKIIVGKDITVHDDYSLLRDNFFEALVALKEYKYL